MRLAACFVVALIFLGVRSAAGQEHPPADPTKTLFPSSWQNWEPYAPPSVPDTIRWQWSSPGVRFQGRLSPTRWLTTDPLADELPAWSPYNYVLNNPLSLTDPDGQMPCCDIDVGISLSIENVEGGYGFRLSAAAGTTFGSGNVQPSLNVSLNVYNAGVGTSQGTTGVLGTQADFVFSGALSVGGGSGQALPLNTLSGLSESGVSNTFANSFTYGQNLVLNSSGRNQRSGSIGFRAGNVAVQTYNDVSYYRGDGNDRFFTGGGTISIASQGNVLSIGADVFTGARMQDPLSTGGFAVSDGYYAGDYSLNNGRTFAILGGHNQHQVSVATGSFHMYSQNIIHDAMRIPRFRSHASPGGF